MRGFRLLPLMIVVLVMFFGIRVYDLAVGIETSMAQDAENVEPQAGTLEAVTPTAGDQTASSETQLPPTENKSSPAEAATGGAVDAMTDEAGYPAVWSRSEVQILQDLAERREELERRSRELDMREKLLKATENRIDEKIASLKKIESRIEGLLKIHDEREQAQLDMLVKTYSSMKSKDAARIFDKLDMDILIRIVEKMKEKNVGAILSDMSPEIAKKLTTELATRRQLPDIEG